jgi:hypothetical protein
MGYNVQAGDGSGGHHVIIGGEAGGGIWAGVSNTLIGHQTGAESLALHHATAIGAGAQVSVSNAVVLGRDANVGIGTSAPTARLHIRSAQANESGIRLEALTSTSPVLTASDRFLSVNERGDVVLARYRLTITHTNEWADRVFSANYLLKPLAEVERYVQTKGHLPGMPSAEDVANQGVDLTELNAKLLEKIEELTLHLIKQEQRIDQLEKQLIRQRN